MHLRFDIDIAMVIYMLITLTPHNKRIHLHIWHFHNWDEHYNFHLSNKIMHAHVIATRTFHEHQTQKHNKEWSRLGSNLHLLHYVWLSTCIIPYTSIYHHLLSLLYNLSNTIIDIKCIGIVISTYLYQTHETK